MTMTSLRKVMIVEDDADQRKLLVDFFQCFYIQTYTTDNAYDALILAEREQPDVVLMDLTIPGKGGVWIAEQLKINQKTKDVPMIALSADLTRKELVRTHEQIFNKVIAKPFDLSLLMSELEDVVKNRRDESHTRCEFFPS